MCFSEFYSILLIKVECAIISSHAPSSINICTFVHICLTSLKTLLGFLPNSLIFLTASSFIALATAFLSAFLNLLNSSFILQLYYLSFIYMIFFSFVFKHLPHCSTTTYLHRISSFSYVRILHGKPLIHLL